MPFSFSYQPQKTIYELGDHFSDAVNPAAFPECHLRYRNQNAATSVGLETLTDEEWKKYFWEFKPLPESLTECRALRYHGHQFQSYNPDLGDGRGFLFAQLKAQNGRLLDLGTKGSGQTPYSRAGDGRLTLKGAMREALATEMLESIGVNTSKTFSFFETGEQLQRNDEPSPTRSAVLVRLSHSHIRFGTFQRLAFHSQKDEIAKLVNYSTRHYFPHLIDLAKQDPAATFFTEVCKRTANLTAEWMIGGFVHGVLNTDNMNITGESFDYGPYRFLPHYDPNFTAAYFDHSGLYAYGRQASACYWNLMQLARCLTLISDVKSLEGSLENFGEHFSDGCRNFLMKRLGLVVKTESDSDEVLTHFFQFLEESKSPYEQTIFDLYGGALDSRLKNSPQKNLYKGDTIKKLCSSIQEHQLLDPKFMDKAYYQQQTAETLLYPEIENIWKEIDEQNNWDLFNQKIDRIRKIRE